METIVISKTDMREKVFDPVVKSIGELIECQINLSVDTSLDHVILSGGLGQSKYLKEYISSLPLVKDKINVYQSESYNQSIVIGAVQIAKNPNAITQRFVRKTYGIEVMQPYNSQTDTVINQEEIAGQVFTKFKFDKFIDMNTSVQTYEYFEKQYSIEYPNNTYAGK